MDMNVDESGRQNSIPEINPAAAGRQLSRGPGDDLNNDAVLKQNQRLIDLLQRRKQCLCGQSKHVGRLTTETSFYRKSSAWLSGWHHLLYLGLVNPLPPPLPRRGPRTILPGNNVRQRADGYGYSLRTIAATRKLKDREIFHIKNLRRRSRADMGKGRKSARNDRPRPEVHRSRCYNCTSTRWFQDTAALGFFCKVLPLSRGVAQPGRAPGSGPGGRRFNSSLPDQYLQGSSPETWVTECTGYMGNTFGPKGFSSGSNTRVSRSK